MAKRPPNGDQPATLTPQEYPQVPPRELYPTSDIRFVMTEIGKLSGQMERLIEDSGKLGDKISGLDRTVDRFKTTIIVGGTCFGLLLSFVWWAYGERVIAVIKPESVQTQPFKPPPDAGVKK